MHSFECIEFDHKHLYSYINEAREMPMFCMLENLFYKMMYMIMGKNKEEET
jgi:hypothetical protein